jgi:tetratricopeptide (TPR) repeat protein
MRYLLVVILILLTVLVLSLPTMAQDTEGGEIEDLLEDVNSSWMRKMGGTPQIIIVVIVFVVTAIGAFIFIWRDAQRQKQRRQLRALIAVHDEMIYRDLENAEAYNDRGILYAKLGEFKQAIMDYNQAISIDPKSARAFNDRGIAYRNLGEYEQALADYNKAIALDPKFAEAYGNRGVFYFVVEEYRDCAQARADLEYFLELAPNDPQADATRQMLLKVS